MYIEEDTLDDLLNFTYSNLLENGFVVKASKGTTREILNATLVLRNPRARISVSESRSQLVSCIGELLWYLTANNSLDFIEYYIKDYRKNIEYKPNEELPAWGAYGPRIFQEDDNGLNQFKAIADLLISKPSSRRAVIAIYSADDNFREDNRDIPCTCNFQFFIRDHKLNMTTYMRSNDAFKGLVHDIFSFTIFQELMLAEISREYKIRWGSDLVLGTYTHQVGSLHIYEENIPQVQSYLNVEGWQNKTEMLPIGSDYLKVDRELMITLEQKLRLNNDSVNVMDFHDFNDSFWKDIAIVLIFYHLRKNNLKKDLDISLILKLRDNCSSLPVKNFLDKRIHELGV